MEIRAGPAANINDEVATGEPRCDAPIVSDLHAEAIPRASKGLDGVGRCRSVPLVAGDRRQIKQSCGELGPGVDRP